jgi:hypothetical protein
MLVEITKLIEYAQQKICFAMRHEKHVITGFEGKNEETSDKNISIK